MPWPFSVKRPACTLPAALLLILWLQGRRINQRQLVQLVPFVVLALGMGLLTVWWERYHQGNARAPFRHKSTRASSDCQPSYLVLPGQTIWPSNLTFIYPQWIVSPTHLLEYAWLAALGGLCAVISFARRYVGRSLEVAALFFVATLSPLLGFHHALYLSLHLCGRPLPIPGQYRSNRACVRRYHNSGRFVQESRHFIFGAAVCILAALTMFTWRQSTIYADIEALWRTTIARNPGCWMAHNNLGIVLSQKGDIDEAIAHYRKTLEMSPDFAEADYNLGNALLQKGEIDAAILLCQRAVTIQPNDPEAQVALGNALFKKGISRRINSSLPKSVGDTALLRYRSL